MNIHYIWGMFYPSTWMMEQSFSFQGRGWYPKSGVLRRLCTDHINGPGRAIDSQCAVCVSRQ